MESIEQTRKPATPERPVITQEQPSRRYLTQNELADLFGVTPQSISMFAQRNEIRSFRVGKQSAFSPENVRRITQARGLTYFHKVLAFQMLKGGSTKTSSAFNLAVRLNQYGAKVLCVDLDMQGNLTDSFGVDIEGQPVFYHLVAGEANLTELIMDLGNGMHLIPSDFDNSVLEFFMQKERKNPLSFVRDALAPVIDRYDFVVIDCNPALSGLNTSIAMAADQVIIPVNPDRYSAKGLKKTIDELTRMSKEYRQKIDYRLLYTLYDGREASSQRYLIQYGSEYKERLMSTVIKRNADVKNAIDQKKSIFDFPRAAAREDFDLVTRELLGWRDIAPKGAGNA